MQRPPPGPEGGDGRAEPDGPWRVAVQHRDPLVQVGRVEGGDQVRGEHLDPRAWPVAIRWRMRTSEILVESRRLQAGQAGADPQVP